MVGLKISILPFPRFPCAPHPNLNKKRSRDDMNADELPVLFLPEPLVFLILHNRWSELLIPTSWHAKLYGPDGPLNVLGRQLFSALHWPPPASPVWSAQQSVILSSSDVPDLDARELTGIADQLRGWSSRILANTPADRQEVEVAALRSTIERVDQWASSLCTSGDNLGLHRILVNRSRSDFLTSCTDMFTAVQV